MSYRRKGERLLTATALFILLTSFASATASPADTIISLFAPGELQSQQELLFGIIAPFLLFFAVIYSGLRQLDTLHKKADVIVSSVISLFTLRTVSPITVNIIRNATDTSSNVTMADMLGKMVLEALPFQPFVDIAVVAGAGVFLAYLLLRKN